MVPVLSSCCRDAILRGLIFLVACSAGLLMNASVVYAQDAAAIPFLRAEVPEGSASGWFRWAVDPAVADSDTAELTVVADGHCSLYVNEQRVLKNGAFRKSDESFVAVSFEVKSLLRQGRNLIAVEVNSEKKAATNGTVVNRIETQRAIGSPTPFF